MMNLVLSTKDAVCVLCLSPGSLQINLDRPADDRGFFYPSCLCCRSWFPCSAEERDKWFGQHMEVKK